MPSPCDIHLGGNYSVAPPIGQVSTYHLSIFTNCSLSPASPPARAATPLSVTSHTFLYFSLSTIGHHLLSNINITPSVVTLLTVVVFAKKLPIAWSWSNKKTLEDGS